MWLSMHLPHQALTGYHVLEGTHYIQMRIRQALHAGLKLI